MICALARIAALVCMVALPVTTRWCCAVEYEAKAGCMQSSCCAPPKACTDGRSVVPHADSCHGCDAGVATWVVAPRLRSAERPFDVAIVAHDATTTAAAPWPRLRTFDVCHRRPPPGSLLALHCQLTV